MTLRAKIRYEPQLTIVKLSGPIDEHVAGPLRDIRAQVRTPKVRFDCEDITFINSIGIATWLAHLRDYDGLDVAFSRCPAVFTGLCLMIGDLAAGRRIESLFARYYCAQCDEQKPPQLISPDDLVNGEFPARPCPRCKSAMTIDPDDEDFRELLLPLAS